MKSADPGQRRTGREAFEQNCEFVSYVHGRALCRQIRRAAAGQGGVVTARHRPTRADNLQRAAPAMTTLPFMRRGSVAK